MAGQTRSPFRARLTATVQEAVLIGVKWSLITVLTLWAVSWALGDYGAVRQRALQGQAAFEYLQKQVAAQQQGAAQKGTP